MLKIRYRQLGQTEADIAESLSPNDYSQVEPTPTPQSSGLIPITPSGPGAPTPTTSPSYSTALLTAAMLQQARYGQQTYPYRPPSSMSNYLPYIIGGAVLLTVVMLSK